MEQKPAIVVDIDGTLANVEHRLHLLPVDKNQDKFEFHLASKDDELNAWCAFLIKSMADKNFKIVLCTSRAEKYRAITETWLFENGIEYTELVMKDIDVHNDDPKVKRHLYKKYIEPKYLVLFVVEDRKNVVDMWRELGLTCLQCAEGNY